MKTDHSNFSKNWRDGGNMYIKMKIVYLPMSFSFVGNSMKTMTIVYLFSILLIKN